MNNFYQPFEFIVKPDYGHVILSEIESNLDIAFLKNKVYFSETKLLESVFQR